MAEETATTEEIQEWANHPYTQKKAKVQRREVEILQKALNQRALGCSDPEIVRIASNLVNAQQYLATLEGRP